MWTFDPIPEPKIYLMVNGKFAHCDYVNCLSVNLFIELVYFWTLVVHGEHLGGVDEGLAMGGGYGGGNPAWQSFKLIYLVYKRYISRKNTSFLA